MRLIFTEKNLNKKDQTSLSIYLYLRKWPDLKPGENIIS